MPSNRHAQPCRVSCRLADFPSNLLLRRRCRDVMHAHPRHLKLLGGACPGVPGCRVEEGLHDAAVGLALAFLSQSCCLRRPQPVCLLHWSCALWDPIVSWLVASACTPSSVEVAAGVLQCTACFPSTFHLVLPMFHSHTQFILGWQVQHEDWVCCQVVIALSPVHGTLAWLACVHRLAAPSSAPSKLFCTRVPPYVGPSSCPSLCVLQAM